MIFIERHIRILAIAIAAMILVRVASVSEASSNAFSGFDGGFLHFPSWMLKRENDESRLASEISQVIHRFRFGQPLIDTSYNLVTGSTGAESGAQTASDSKKAEPSGEGEKKEKSPEKEKAPEKEKSKENEKSSGANKPVAQSTEGGSALPALAPAPQDAAERSVLERLGLRRTELDKREQALADREAMLKAAEQRLAERNDELKKLEADLKIRIDARNAELTSLKPMVTIYETMKPKDAARVFEKLEFPVLVSLAGAMNPRKLSDVLAQMDPVVAGKLTKTITASGRSSVLPVSAANSEGMQELPDFSPQGTP